MPTKRSVLSTTVEARGKDEFVAPNTLQFDFQNPRIVDGQFNTEEELIQHLVEDADVDELVQSILSAGYVDYEPLIVLETGRIVIEGNRRLAALRLISSKTLRDKLRFKLPVFESAQPLVEEVRVRFVGSRADARSFIGFKHINGPFKWDALAKAKYAAQWFVEGGDIATISRTWGDNHNTVRRLVNGWYALQQAQADGFEIAKTTKRTFAFSHLYTALTRVSVREFLGLADEDVSKPPRKNPIPKSHREQLGQLMSWLYGQENEPTVIKSQNPDLNRLSDVLGHKEGRRMLIAKRDLDTAYSRVEPASSRFEDALMTAAKHCEDALGLARGYEGDQTLMKVAEGMQRTVRSLVVSMKDAAETGTEDA